MNRPPPPVLLMARELTFGGTERQLVETARSLDRARFDPRVGVFYPGGARYDDLLAAGVPVLEFPVRSFLNPSILSAAAGLIRYIRKERIALVHAFDPPLNAFAAPLARLASRARVLTSVRGSRQLVPPIQHRWMRWADQLADGVVVNCLAMRREVAAGNHVAPSRIHLCYNGLDTGVFYPDRVPNEVPIIGCVCALRAEKGLDTLVRAFARLPRNGPTAELLLIGDGAALPGLETLAASLALGSRIRFEPGTTNVAQWLQRIDIFVLPKVFGIKRPMYRVATWSELGVANWPGIVAILAGTTVGVYTAGILPFINANYIGFPALQAWITGAVVYLVGVALAHRSGAARKILGFSQLKSEG